MVEPPCGRPGLREIADEGTDQAALVDPLVRIEALVLRRDEGLLHALRNVGQHHPHPALVLLEHLRKALALAVEHHAGAGQLDALELGVIGQVRDRLVVEIDHVGEIDRRGRHLLVLAELPVGSLQIGEIDAAEHLALARDRLRVLHGGRDQLVEIDVLDVEGLAHMRAARPQQRRHRALVGHPIEPGRNLIRRCRHLTECKRSRKNLDEESFHRNFQKLKLKAGMRSFRSASITMLSLILVEKVKAAILSS